MIKQKELADPTSCMNRAHDDEMTFVLLGRDPAAPIAIRAWIEERIRLGKNTRLDAQIAEAEQCLVAMGRSPILPPNSVQLSMPQDGDYTLNGAEPRDGYYRVRAGSVIKINSDGSRDVSEYTIEAIAAMLYLNEVQFRPFA